MKTKVYILVYKSFSGDRLLNCRVLTVHKKLEDAKLVLYALKYGHKYNFNDAQIDEKNELKLHITSDTMRGEYEIETRELM